MEKKQIVFIEPSPTVTMLRIARRLKLTGKYEMVLVCFSDIDKEFYKKSYDKILTLNLSHKLKASNLFDLSRKILTKKVRTFLKKINEMKPYIFQITGPDLFSLIVLNSLKKHSSPKIYYSNDIWGSDKRNFFFTKNFWIKGEFQKFCEKKCFKKVEGVINKKSLEEFELLSYKINVPKMALFPSCSDEWILSPKKKKTKEIHVVFASSPAHPLFKGEIHFRDIIKTITSQKIHFHTYGPCINKKHNQEFIKESKNNKYYHFHGWTKPDVLNKEMNNYDYGIFLSFIDASKTDLFLNLAKELNAKMINYLESGLPMIINNQYRYMSEIIEKYGIGFSVSWEDFKNLRKIIEKKDYFKFQKSVKNFQKKFKLSEQIKDIENFYKKVINNV